MISPDVAVTRLVSNALRRWRLSNLPTLDLARHVLAVLDDAGAAVVPLPPITKERISATGVRRAWFGPIDACLYPQGGWTISDSSGHWDGDSEDDAEQAAAGIIAARRWVRNEADRNNDVRDR
jgi:hypothetical protein